VLCALAVAESFAFRAICKDPRRLAWRSWPSYRGPRSLIFGLILGPLPAQAIRMAAIACPSPHSLPAPPESVRPVRRRTWRPSGPSTNLARPKQSVGRTEQLEFVRHFQRWRRAGANLIGADGRGGRHRDNRASLYIDREKYGIVVEARGPRGEPRPVLRHGGTILPGSSP